MSITLQIYYGKKFLLFFSIALIGLSLFVLLIDVSELFRRAADKPNIEVYHILKLSVLKIWQSLYIVLPFAVLISTIAFFIRSINNNEIIALKAAGVSNIQILIAPIACVIIIGTINLLAIHHITVLLSAKYEILQRNLFSEQINKLSLSQNGIWLRQEGKNNINTIIYAEYAENNGKILENVEFFILTKHNNSFLQRLSAKKATLHNGFWRLNGVTSPDGAQQGKPLFVLATDLTPRKIENGLAGPDNLSLWELPQFIKDLKASGFNTISYRLQLQKLIAQPLFFLAILMLTAGILLRIQKKENIAHYSKISFFAALSGLGLYFLNNLIYAWGFNGNLPVTIAAWIPSIIALCIAAGLLLSLEEK